METKDQNRIDFLLFNIQDSMENVIEFMGDIDQDFFLNNNLTKDAVAFNFHVIGLRAEKLPKFFKSNYTIIDWEILSGLKDRIMPEYYNIDYKEIWNFSTHEIPINKQKIDQLLYARKS